MLVPHITPGGLDEFADKVVPLLQERGVFRTGYQGNTLREHLLPSTGSADGTRSMSRSRRSRASGPAACGTC
jgi:hypothetical protein